jgi:DNA polymerase-3 subunit gamma/tau
LAEGSFRDALGILQKVLAVSDNKKIEVAEVEAVTGAPRGELVRKLLEALAKKDAARGLEAIRTAVSENMDARMLAKLLIHRMRIVLLMRYAPETADAFAKELTESDLALARSLAKEPGVNSETLRALLSAYGTMAYAAVPHLPLELAAIEITSVKE